MTNSPVGRYSTVLRGLSWLVLGRILSDGFGFLLYIALARAFGESGLGDYAFAFAVALLCGTGVRFGFRPLVTREIARQPYLAADYVGRVLVIQVGLAALIGASGLMLLMAVGEYSLQLNVLIILAFAAVALEAMGVTFAACLEAVEALNKSASLEMAMRAVAMASGLILIMLGAPIHIVVVAHVLGSLTYFFTGLYWVITRFGSIRLKFDWKFAKAKLNEALPFVGQAALFLLYTRIDVMMLHSITGELETGRYAAAMRLTTTPLMLAVVVGIAIYPRMSRGDRDTAEQRVLFLSALKWLGLIGMAGAVVLATVGDELLVLILGRGFVEAGALMPWASVLFFVGFARVPYERLLYANNRERIHLHIEIAALIINVTLNALLIPRWGAYGAVWASIASQVFVLGGLHVFSMRIVTARYIVQAARLLLAGACGLVGAMALQHVAAWPLVIALAPSLVVTTAIVLGLITSEERKILGGRVRWWS